MLTVVVLLLLLDFLALFLALLVTLLLDFLLPLHRHAVEVLVDKASAAPVVGNAGSNRCNIT